MKKFKIETWTIKKLYQTFIDKKLNLNPPYQRNNIWTVKAQRLLIASIKNGMPLPNFFLHEIDENTFDVADGQQRSRAIFAFISKEINDMNNLPFNNDDLFMSYEIPVVIIDKSINQEKIREFYVTVNNTGMKLNQPEITKAEYFNSNILNCVEEIVDSASFKKLNIFKARQSDRMIDREFVEELVALLYYGIGDKKNDVKKLYSEEFSHENIEDLKIKFENIISVFTNESIIVPFSNSRYIQRNDFYTLFKFVNDNLTNFSKESFCQILNLLFKIQYDISPSNEQNDDLMYYAFNCVSQSNSKQAREERLKFLRDLIINPTNKPNKLQKSLIKYYGLTSSALIKVDKYFTLDSKLIVTKFQK